MNAGTRRVPLDHYAHWAAKRLGPFGNVPFSHACRPPADGKC